MIGWLTVCVVLIASAALAVYLGKKAFCLTQTFTALLVQIFLGVTFLVVWGLQGDANTYHEAAKTLVDTWSAGIEPVYTLPPGKQSTVWIAGAIYWLVGPLPVIYLLFLATFTAMIPALLAITTRLFNFTSAAPLAAWLGVVAPPFIVWAPWMRRESLIFVLIGMTLVTLGLVYDSRWKLALLMWPLTAVMLAVSRPQVLLVLAVGSIAAVALRNRKTQPNFYKSALQYSITIFMLAISGILIWWTLTSTGTSATIQDGTRQGIMREISNPSQALGIRYEDTPSSDTPSSDTPSESATHADLLNKGVELGQRLVNSMVGPFPWQWSSRSWIVAGLDGLFMLCAWILVAVGFVRYPQARKVILILVVAALPLIAGEAYMHGNYGITMRVRAHYLIVLLPVISVILSLFANNFLNKRVRKGHLV